MKRQTDSDIDRIIYRLWVRQNDRERDRQTDRALSSTATGKDLHQWRVI